MTSEYSPVYDDLRFPLTGRNIDVVSGRLDFDYYNGTVTFAANARFDLAETISFTVQLPHAWKQGTSVHPHIHWVQQGADVPNWLVGYKIYKKGTTSLALETDFSNHIMLPHSSNVYTYSSGVLEQITSFGLIDMTGCTISDTLHMCLWRDSANTSGEFAGADPSAIVEHIREFDIHIVKDSDGSHIEFSK
jgi:hypothetical protein